MENIINNEGLLHIGELIVSYLDMESLVACRLVSKAMKVLVEDKKLWYIRQIQGLLNIKVKYMHRCGILINKEEEVPWLVRNPLWRQMLEPFDDMSKPLEDLRVVANFMTYYFIEGYGETYPSPIFIATKLGNIEFVKLFISGPIDLMERDGDGDGNYLIHHACGYFGSREMVKLYLTAVHQACSACRSQDRNWHKYHYETQKELYWGNGSMSKWTQVMREKNMLESDFFKNNLTYTYVAKYRMSRIAIRHGSPIRMFSRCNFDGVNPIQMAYAYGNHNIVEYLISNAFFKKSNLPFLKNLSEQSKARVKTILDTVDINRKYSDGETLFHKACRNGDLKIVELLNRRLPKCKIKLKRLKKPSQMCQNILCYLYGR